MPCVTLYETESTWPFHSNKDGATSSVEHFKSDFSTSSASSRWEAAVPSQKLYRPLRQLYAADPGGCFEETPLFPLALPGCEVPPTLTRKNKSLLEEESKLHVNIWVTRWDYRKCVTVVAPFFLVPLFSTMSWTLDTQSLYELARSFTDAINGYNSSSVNL